MGAGVFRHSLGHKVQEIPSVRGPTAEIHILEPQGPKLLVEAA
jgi:hypothetical protein